MTCSWNLSRSSHFLNLSWNHFLKVFSIAVATCNYIRYGRGGGQEIKNAICVLGLNMINDKVLLFIIFLYPHIFNSLYLYILMHISPYPRFPHILISQVFAILWLWHCILIFAGLNRYHLILSLLSFWYPFLVITIFAGSNRCGRFVLISWRYPSLVIIICILDLSLIHIWRCRRRG